MKKAVILEIKDQYAVAMNDEGRIIRLRNRNYKVGETIFMEEKAAKKKHRVVWSTVAASLVVLFGIGLWSFLAPYTYVSLDVNPSIEYSVNRFGLVLSADAVNGDGEEILDGLSLRYQSIEDAVEETVEEIKANGYFDGEEPNSIMIATSCENEAEADQLRIRLQERVQETVSDTEEEVEVETVAVGEERVEEAKELGTTPGKLNLIEKMIDSSDDPDSIDVEEWVDKSVKEIMETTKENKKASKVQNNTKDEEEEDEDNDEETSEDSSGNGSGNTQNGEQNGSQN